MSGYKENNPVVLERRRLAEERDRAEKQERKEREAKINPFRQAILKGPGHGQHLGLGIDED